MGHVFSDRLRLASLFSSSLNKTMPSFTVRSPSPGRNQTKNKAEVLLRFACYIKFQPIHQISAGTSRNMLKWLKFSTIQNERIRRMGYCFGTKYFNRIDQFNMLLKTIVFTQNSVVQDIVLIFNSNVKLYLL